MFLLSVVPIHILAQNLAILWKKMTAILHDPSEGLYGPDLWKKRLWIFFFNGVKIFQSDQTENFVHIFLGKRPSFKHLAPA